MRAIILCGGFGTRLQSVITDVPKPMAPVNGKPFLRYLLDYLITQGIQDFILSVHHQRQVIIDYFQQRYKNATIQYAIEERPLGTGGAILNAIALLENQEPIWVINGDTYLLLDYKAMHFAHLQQQAQLTLALQEMDNCSRYGDVAVENNTIIKFNHQGGATAGLINAGVYLLNPSIFSTFQLPQEFSFEKDFLHPYTNKLHPAAFIARNYFIDIGVPEDYARANVEFAKELG